MTAKFKHGQVWLANLNPSRGKEPGKTRLVLIVQNQILLDINHPFSLIIPLTTKLIDEAEPLRLRIKSSGQLKHDSDLLIDQIRAIDNKRIISGPLYECSTEFMRSIYQAINEVLGSIN